MHPEIEKTLKRIAGGEIKTACVYSLIDTYYMYIVGDIEAEDSDLDPPFPEELLQPIEDRESGIGSALKILLDEGHNVNDSDDDFNALMLAVGSGDAPMVRFLIQHGADANSWPNMEESLPGEGNYYLDEIDINYMNECFANDKDIDYLKALSQTAFVLVEDAHLGPYSGFSLKIDENGTVSLGPAKTLF